MPTEQQTETRREIAERIIELEAGIPFDSPSLHAEFRENAQPKRLISAIEAALKDRDERAARIAETIPDTKFDLDHEPAPTERQIRNGIAAAIRNEDHK